jgi:hypothetical protein
LLGEAMSKAGDDVQIIPPKGDDSGRKTTPVDGVSKDSHMEQLKLQRKIDRLKKKLNDSKSHEVASSSSSKDETDASSEE